MAWKLNKILVIDIVCNAAYVVKLSRTQTIYHYITFKLYSITMVDHKHSFDKGKVIMWIDTGGIAWNL